MKRTIAGVAVVAGIVQLTAVPAQAASSVDPVKALKVQLARGNAINVQSTAKLAYTRDLVITSGLDGTIEFGPRGAFASDVARTLHLSDELLRGVRSQQTEALVEGPIRMISSLGVSYVSGPVVDDALPRDTSWVRYGSASLPSSNALLEILEPATLKTLMAQRTSWRDGVVKGSIKASKIAAVSPAFVSTFGARFKSGRDGKISYTLRLSPNGLAERLSARAVLPISGRSIQVEADTRYRDWGHRVTVLLPLEGDVIDRKEVADQVPADAPGTWG
ncbi:hypothetical protein [Nonomuraea sp. LPB2021202275-12-8]|uniref:hypothetical protein n=1 Tax=Nonomuraea sp. LPB2021202275-12-8 TaxID=3120159 RepID=UPI00300C0CE6